MKFIKLIQSDLQSKLPYLEKDLEKTNIDKNQYQNIIELCNKADPTGNKAVYTQWILKQYINNNFKGEEDIEKFRDTLQKFTKLKNSKKIQPADLNQYQSFSDLVKKVEETLNSLGGYTSNREEETTKEREGIKFIDSQNGIELYLVNTPEAAAKEFRNTKWCVKDPRWFNEYAENDSNFYYFKKDGKPFLLLHEDDFRDVYDSKPNEKDMVEVAPFIIEYNLPYVYELLRRRIITKDSSYFGKAVEEVINSRYHGCGYNLLKNEIITKDSPYFKKAIDDAIKDKDAHFLLQEEIITKDSPYFEELVKTAINDGYAYELLRHKTITKDSPYFNKAVEEVVNNACPGNIRDLLRDKTITKDSPYFNKAVEKVDNSIFYDLVQDKVITEEELQKFKKQSSLNNRWIRIL